MIPEHVTVAEFAARMHRHPETIRRLIRSGDLPAVRFGGGTYLIPVDQAERALQGHMKRMETMRRAAYRRANGIVL